MTEPTDALPHQPSTEQELEEYARGVSHLPLYDGVGLARILEGVRAGDENALEALVRAHLRHVVDEALRLRGTGVALKDLIAAGNRGLREAARRFDAARDGGFDAYARTWIRRELRTHLDTPT